MMVEMTGDTVAIQFCSESERERGEGEAQGKRCVRGVSKNFPYIINDEWGGSGPTSCCGESDLTSCCRESEFTN